MSAATYLRRKFKRLCFVLFVLVLAVVVWFGAPASVCYRVQEAYQFQAGDKDGKVRLAALLPKSGPYQAVSLVGVFWDGAQVRESLQCLDILKLEARLKARQHKEAIIVYDVSLPQGKARWEEAIEGFELQPQKEIESDHPIIVAQASQLVHAQGREDAYRIYKFTAAHLSWRWWSEGGSNFSASALKAYQTRVGACGEFANLMVALCRAARIPARTISGLDLPSYPPFWSATRVWGHPGVAHAWTEFHGLAGWEMADPSGA